MRLLIDCDGVICDSDAAFREALLGVAGRYFDYAEVTDWNYQKALGISPTEEAEAWRSVDPYRFETYPGAEDGVRSLQQFSDVVFVTAPSAHVPNWTHARDEWLEARFPGVPVIHTRHKELIHGDALIDDRMANIAAWTKAHPQGLGILWSRPWNVPYPGGMVCRTGDWCIARELLRPRPPQPDEATRVALGRAP